MYGSWPMTLWDMKKHENQYIMSHNAWLRRRIINIFSAEDSEFFAGSNKVRLMTHGTISLENHGF